MITWPDAVRRLEAAAPHGVTRVWPRGEEADEPLRVWRVDLARVPADGLGPPALAPDEQAYAAGIDDAPAARRYSAGRLALRAILSACIGVPPDAVRLVRGPFGRPECAEGRPFFSLSRSRDLALVAVSLRAPVGVDLEHAAGGGLEPAGVPGVATMGDWTRLEAVLKALGFGLSVEPHRVEIRPAAAGPPLVRLDGRELSVARLFEVDAGPDVVASVAELAAR